MMKKVLIILLSVAILAAAGIALAGINNTPHNIPQFVSGKTGEPCAYCHTPHVGGTGDPTYPLWNRSQNGITYTMYSSPTFDMTPGPTRTQAQVDMSTRACLQCHNGVASELINYPGRGLKSASAEATYNFTGTDLGNLANIGTDLRQEHPVGFTYNPSLDNENNGFPAISSGKVGTTNLPLYGTDITQVRNMLGCGSCHEPHDRYTYTGKNATQVYFLRNATASDNGNAGSAMCKACHVNKY